MNKQRRETPDNVDALVLRVRLLRHKNDRARALQAINHAIEVNKPKKSGTAMSTLYWWKAYLYNAARDYKNEAVNFKKAYDLSKKEDKDNRHSICCRQPRNMQEIGKSGFLRLKGNCTKTT